MEISAPYSYVYGQKARRYEQSSRHRRVRTPAPTGDTTAPAGTEIRATGDTPPLASRDSP
jgi:hypothetical protein